jgi:8-oxo-dGTP pyrophosphatase MutT (NUDIX family)
MKTESLLAALQNHRAFDAIEEQHRLDTILFVQHHRENCWRRTTLAGHITAAAWVLNAERTHALLLHHAKLDRWLQPGGHVDESDVFPYDGALREAREETGIASLTLASELLFDVDVHHIPSRGAEPLHLHYDVRYLIVASDDAVTLSDESIGFRWISLVDIAAKSEPSIARMAQRCLQQKTPT